MTFGLLQRLAVKFWKFAGGRNNSKKVMIFLFFSMIFLLFQRVLTLLSEYSRTWFRWKVIPDIFLLYCFCFCFFCFVFFAFACNAEGFSISCIVFLLIFLVVTVFEWTAKSFLADALSFFIQETCGQDLISLKTLQKLS